MTKTHALLLKLTAHPDDDGKHPRTDTVASDTIKALEDMGYEDVEIISQDVH